MTTFSEILDAADGLTVSEQETLLEILRHRIAERNRARLADDVAEARIDFAGGQVRAVSVTDLMSEIRGEA